MFLVDTNVLLDIFTNDAKWRSWSERAISDALVAGPVAVNAIIYAETSLAFSDADTLDRHLDALMLVCRSRTAPRSERGVRSSDTGVPVERDLRRCRTSISAPTRRQTA